MSSLGRHTTLPAPSVLTDPKALQTSLVRAFMETLLRRQDWSNYWLLIIHSTSSSSPLPGSVDGGWKFRSSNHIGGSPGNQLPILRVFPKVLLNLKSRAVERGLLQITEEAPSTSMLQNCVSCPGQMLKQKMFLLFLSLRNYKDLGRLGGIVR